MPSQVCLFLFLCLLHSLCVPASSALVDLLVFGDPASEKSHNFTGSDSVLGVASSLPLLFPQSVSYRQVGADVLHTQNQTLTGNQSSFLTFTINVDSVVPTYITLKLYGSDNQTCAIMLYWRPPEQPPVESLYPGMVSIGSGLLQLGWFYPLPGQQASGFAPIELVNRGINSRPRHFHYSTMLIPLSVTNNRTSLRVMLGGWGNVNGYFFPFLEPLDHALKPIYRVYVHTDPYLQPLPSPQSQQQAADIQHYEPHTHEPVPQVPALPLWNENTQPIPVPILQANLTLLRENVDAAISEWMSVDGHAQVFGPVWNASLDIYNPDNPYATPSVLWGAPSIPPSMINANLTKEEWLNRAPYLSTNSNNGPVQLAAGLALGYTQIWSKHYHQAEILARVIACLDYYMHEQGSDGGLLAMSPDIGWHGAPNRKPGLGNPLDGAGPHALGRAVLLLYDELNQSGQLDVLIDYNLDGKSMIPRRQGWWRMFQLNIQRLFTVQDNRGGCPNQDLFQVESMLVSNKACGVLLPDTPLPLTQSDIQLIVNQSTGFADQARFPEDGPFFTPTGMIMECFGINGGGGLEFNYGANVLVLLLNLVYELNPREYDYITRRAQDAYNHYIRYVYTGYAEADHSAPLNTPLNPSQLKVPSTVEVRGDYQPDLSLPANVMYASIYHAVQHNNPLALRLIHTQMMHKQWYPTGMTPDNLIFLIPLWNNLTYLINHIYDSQYADTEPLPSELYLLNQDGSVTPTLDSAHVEITAAGACIKLGMDRWYVNMNYRHAVNQVNQLVKLMHLGTNTTRVATCWFNATGGFWGLWTFNYGQLFIAINRNNETRYNYQSLQYNRQSRYVKELITGNRVDLETQPAIPTWTAWVWVPTDDQRRRESVE